MTSPFPASDPALGPSEDMAAEPSETLLPVLAHALTAKGYETLTEVQTAMLDTELAGRDLLVSARTGSGKTVGFGLAIGRDLLSEEGQLPMAGAPLALAVAPTRELAVQVARELSWLYGEAGVRVATCIGGMEIRAERRSLSRGAHIVVGTPGRLVDHIGGHALDLSALRAVILDEADEMLNLGFREELETILEACPDERRTLMFSATVSGGIAALAGRYQRDALRIVAGGPARQHEDIAYKAFITAQHDGEKAIVNTLRYHDAENALVFCSTRAAVARLTQRLGEKGLSVVSMSGELSQNERTSALQAMRDGRARVCVATDVAARGIDLPGLELVIHADLPKNREALLHRSGRTGRAGRKGTSVLIVPPRARRRVESLLKDAGVTAEWADPPGTEDVRAKEDERLLADPLLTQESETSDLVRTIASTYSAEHLAAAFIRLHRAGRPDPESLSVVAAYDAPKERKPRAEIERSAWVVLSVGRSKRAEPRWLLPMLCKAGGMEKSAIGAIRVKEHETYVQLDAVRASDFLARMGQAGRLEGGIDVRPAGGPPGDERETAPQPAARKPAPLKPEPRRVAPDHPPKARRAAPRPHARGGAPMSGKAGSGKAGSGKAGSGKMGPGKAGPQKAGPGKAGTANGKPTKFARKPKSGPRKTGG